MNQEEKAMLKNQLTKMLNNVLADNGWSQARLARFLGISQPTLNEKINNGTMRYIDVVHILGIFGETLQRVKKNDI